MTYDDWKTTPPDDDRDDDRDDEPRPNEGMDMSEHGWLYDYETGDALRAATEAERRASTEAAQIDGGAGVITVDGRRCYVVD